MKKRLEKSLTKSKKIGLIKEKYGQGIKPVEFDKIPYIKKVYLLAVFRVLTDEEFDKILPLKSNLSSKILSPTQSMDISILECLNSSNVIVVDPKSDPSSFEFIGDECVGFNAEEVSWLTNICNKSEKKLQLFECFRLIYDDLTEYIPTSKSSIEQIYSFTLNLALNEVENYLLFKTNELGYEFNFGNKTFVYIYQLLKKFSVSEICCIVDKSIDSDYLCFAKSQNKATSIGNTISSRLIENGESILRKNHSIEKLSRIKGLRRSELSKVFYELIHQGKDEGFSICPKTYWSETLSSCYIIKP